jgi:hypothetical protein
VWVGRRGRPPVCLGPWGRKLKNSHTKLPLPSLSGRPKPEERALSQGLGCLVTSPLEVALKNFEEFRESRILQFFSHWISFGFPWISESGFSGWELGGRVGRDAGPPPPGTRPLPPPDDAGHLRVSQSGVRSPDSGLGVTCHSVTVTLSPTYQGPRIFGFTADYCLGSDHGVPKWGQWGVTHFHHVTAIWRQNPVDHYGDSLNSRIESIIRLRLIAQSPPPNLAGSYE